MSDQPVYCVDASSFIDGYLDVYPFDIFVRLWANEGQQDDLYAWATAHKQIFVSMGSGENAKLRQMVSAFPQLADPIRSKSCASTADQILVAIAATRGHVVVSEERQGSPQKPKIPELCDHFGVRRIQFLDIVKWEGWTFP